MPPAVCLPLQDAALGVRELLCSPEQHPGEVNRRCDAFSEGWNSVKTCDAKVRQMHPSEEKRKLINTLSRHNDNNQAKIQT